MGADKTGNCLLQEFPESTGRALEQLLTLAEDGSGAVRGGTAAALRALAPLLGQEHVSLLAERPLFAHRHDLIGRCSSYFA